MKISNQAGGSLLVAAGLMAFPLTGLAAAEGLSYTYSEIDYINLDVDQGGESGIFRDEFDNGDGYGIRASAPLGETVYLFGSYTDTEADFSFVDNEGVVRPGDTQVKKLNLGVGLIVPMSDISDLLLSGAYADIDYDDFNLGAGSSIRPGDLDDDPSDGFLVDLSWRSQLTANIEGSIGGRYTEIENVDGLSVVGNLMYELTPNVGFNLSLDAGDELLTWGVGVRYSL